MEAVELEWLLGCVGIHISLVSVNSSEEEKTWKHVK